MPSNWVEADYDNIDISIKKLRKQSENVVFNSIDGWKKKSHTTEATTSNSIDLSPPETKNADIKKIIENINDNGYEIPIKEICNNNNEKKVQIFESSEEFEYYSTSNNSENLVLFSEKEKFNFSLSQQNLEIQKNNPEEIQTQKSKNDIFKNIASNFVFENK